MVDGLRLCVIPTLTSSVSHLAYDSAILLPAKLGNLAKRSGKMHVHLLLPRDASDVVSATEFFTPEYLPAHVCHSAEGVVFPGVICDPSSAFQAVQSIGPDALVFTNALGASLYGVYLSMMRSDVAARPPFILWDFSPMSSTSIDNSAFLRGNPRAALAAALGYCMSDVLWTFSQSALNCAVDAVASQMGFALAQSVETRAVICPSSIDMKVMQDAVGNECSAKCDTFTIHIGGRWSSSKRYDVLSSAIVKLKAAGSDDIDVLYTGMPLSRNERAFAIQAGFELVHGLKQEDAWKVVRTCHIGVNLQDAQCIPSMPLEELALGLPVAFAASSHFHRAFPCYPFVFDGEDGLMRMILYMKQNYAQCVAEAKLWSDEYLPQFDFEVLLSHLGDFPRAITDVNLAGYSVVVDRDGVVSLDVRGRLSRIIRGSYVELLIARLRARQLGYEEDLKEPRPKFRMKEK